MSCLLSSSLPITTVTYDMHCGVTGEYQRLDVLQRDICAILCRASQLGRGLDVLDLARKFMSAREELCGESRGRLWSPALKYTLK